MSSPLAEKRASSLEWALGALTAIAVQALLFVILESKADAVIHPEARQPITMKVDSFVQRPLLKLGSKKPVKKALPQLVKKKKPTVVKRKEARAAPQEEAVDDIEEASEVELADEKHEAPKEEEETVEKLEQELLDEEPEEKPPEHTEQGAEDGSEQGTEIDPQKAFILNQYRVRVIAWFQQRFRRPTDQIDCETLRNLSAGVSVTIGSDRKVQSFSITSPSGNAIFDQRVTGNMGSLVGQMIPPPPPLYPEFLQSTLYPRLSGNAGPCPKTFKPKAQNAPTATTPAAPSSPDAAPSVPEAAPTPSETE